MANEKKSKPQQSDEQIKDLAPKKDEGVLGGKHPAKVTVPDLKLG